MSTGASMSASKRASEVLTPEVRNRITTQSRSSTREAAKVQDSRFAEIKSNAFFKIMFSEGTPEAKVEAIAKELTFEGTKEQNRERIKAFELFKEYLMNVSEEMSSEIVRTTDTEAFSELQNVYKDFTDSLNDFEELMQPLTEILDALYTMRTNGVTFDVLNDIRNDKKREEEFNAKKAEILTKFNLSKESAKSLEDSIAVLGEDKGFFGFGGVRKESREQIALKQQELDRQAAEVSRLQSELSTLETNGPKAGDTGEFAVEKQKLRELLDLTSEEHRIRQQELVQSALTFIKTAKERTGSVRDHLNAMGGQIDKLKDANGQMRGVYATLTDSIKVAGDNNQKIRSKYEAPEGEETTLRKMEREDNKLAVEEHIKLLDNSAADTISAFADLQTQGIRIQSMQDTNVAQVAKINAMNSRGVAAVADRLSVVLQAVSSAALGESSAMAGDTLARMNQSTNNLSQKEVIKNALGISERNSELVKAIEDLAAYGDVVIEATNITREGVTESKNLLAEMERIARDVQDNLNDSVAINANVGAGTAKEKAAPAAADDGNPFGFRAAS